MLSSKRYNVKNFSEFFIPLILFSFPSFTVDSLSHSDNKNVLTMLKHAQVFPIFTLLIHLKVLQVSQLNHLNVHWTEMNSIITVALHSLCSIRHSVYDMVYGISELSLL
jgi:hypothetical protein